jgi:hypothetical protein
MGCCSGTGSTPGISPPVAPSTEPAPDLVPEEAPAPAPAPTTYAPDLAHVTDQLRDALTRLNQLGITTPGTQPITPAVTTRFAVGADQPLLEAALGELRRSPTGAPILAGLERSNIQMRVLDDAQFDQMDKQGSAAVYDPKLDTMFLRRSWLQRSPGKTASLIAHEGQHALDDLGNVGMATLQQRTTQLANGGAVTPAIVQQAGWEVSIAKETRGYMVQGQVLRELGLVDPTKVGGPLLVAAQGANDRATYDAVFRGLVSSPEGGYNPEGRQAQPLYLS